MIPSVRVAKGVEGVVGIDPEGIGCNKDGSAGAERDVASAIAHCACSYGCCGIVACTGDDFDMLRQSQRCRNLREKRADDLVTLKELRHLHLPYAADIQHLLGPTPVFDVQQQHAARVRVITAMYARQSIVDIILRQHDLFDAGEVLRLMLFHPKQLRRSEACKGDIACVFRQLAFADLCVEPFRFLRRASVVPKDRGTDHVVVLIQSHKPVHLSADADALDRVCVIAL